MPIIDIHATQAEYLHLMGIIEDIDARLCGEYDPTLDDLERDAAEIRWQLCHA
jgi:hypothetical protein